ncbi:MAG: hypothetical protein JXR31_13570 [Prolixibacteraceae bacterium]|nr:hypothetical protein [Prolixibacteraceae bacterium]MBN2775279.1 hypothetical protein [Prolixibacteraceae bacterium]
MIDFLKKRWGITSGFQVIIILIVFAITGFSVMYIKDFLFNLLNITYNTSPWLRVPLYILIVLPAYQVILLTVGTLFGQFRFFWNFEKKLLNRFRFKKKKKEQLGWLRN